MSLDELKSKLGPLGDKVVGVTPEIDDPFMHNPRQIEVELYLKQVHQEHIFWFANDNAQKSLGFDYQKLITLEYCLNAKKNEHIWIECKGDVADKETSIEVKHHNKAHSLISNSIDVWTTLKNSPENKYFRNIVQIFYSGWIVGLDQYTVIQKLDNSSLSLTPKCL